jgi:hypothetical protein
VERPVFSRNFYRELAQDNPFGLTLDWTEAEAWFNHIAWPAYKTYKYKRHAVAVRRWWARTSLADLERARDAIENAEMEKAQAEQDALPDSDFAQDESPHTATIHKIFGGKSGAT